MSPKDISQCFALLHCLLRISLVFFDSIWQEAPLASISCAIVSCLQEVIAANTTTTTTTTTNADPEFLVLEKPPESPSHLNPLRWMAEALPAGVSTMWRNDESPPGLRHSVIQRVISSTVIPLSLTRGGVPFVGKSCCQGGYICSEAGSLAGLR